MPYSPFRNCGNVSGQLPVGRHMNTQTGTFVSGSNAWDRSSGARIVCPCGPGSAQTFVRVGSVIHYDDDLSPHDEH